MFKYFCHCNKEVEKVLLEDISKDMEILHELESFNSSLDFMQEKFSEKNQNKALADLETVIDQIFQEKSIHCEKYYREP